ERSEDNGGEDGGGSSESVHVNRQGIAANSRTQCRRVTCEVEASRRHGRALVGGGRRAPWADVGARDMWRRRIHCHRSDWQGFAVREAGYRGGQRAIVDWRNLAGGNPAGPIRGEPFALPVRGGVGCEQAESHSDLQIAVGPRCPGSTPRKRG